MLWDRENLEYEQELPANRYRVEYGIKFPGTSDKDWEDDSIGNSNARSKDFNSKSAAIKKAKDLLKDSNCSYSRVVEIEAVLTSFDDSMFEWEIVDEGDHWN
jgi:hypothetical protein